jgi:hypothetical protein
LMPHLLPVEKARSIKCRDIYGKPR